MGWPKGRGVTWADRPCISYCTTPVVASQLRIMPPQRCDTEGKKQVVRYRGCDTEDAIQVVRYRWCDTECTM